jgi:hypothetical protein
MIRYHINSLHEYIRSWLKIALCGYKHRVNRVPGFLSRHPNWVPQSLTRNPPFGSKGGDTLACGGGGGGTQFLRMGRHSGSWYRYGILGTYTIFHLQTQILRKHCY